MPVSHRIAIVLTAGVSSDAYSWRTERLAIVDAATGRHLPTLTYDPVGPHCVAWSSDGQRLVVGRNAPWAYDLPLFSVYDASSLTVSIHAPTGGATLSPQPLEDTVKIPQICEPSATCHVKRPPNDHLLGTHHTQQAFVAAANNRGLGRMLGVRTGRRSKYQRAVQIERRFRAHVFDLVLPVSAEIVEPQAVLLRVDQFAQPIL